MPRPTHCVLLTLLLSPLLATTACNGTHPSPHDPAVTISQLVRDQLTATQRATLESPDSMHLAALDPTPVSFDPKRQRGELMHEYEVLGKTELTAGDRTEAVNAVYESISGNTGVVAACFNPRHGLRASKGDSTVEVVICFECLSLVIVENGQRTASIIIGQDGSKALTSLLTTAGIALAKD
ncbi:MAG: hypothetical protein AAF581_19765 [Planctomycetota bacterium]